MNILIIGAGQVGFELASMLSKESHNVCVIDNDVESINRIREKVDAKAILGSGTNAISLEEASISEIDLFIAVSSVDEVNIMSCLLAKEYGVKRSVARVLNSDYILDGHKLSGINLGIEKIVNPYQVVAEEVSKLCDFSDVTEIARFFDDELLHLGYPIKSASPFVGKELVEIGDIDGKKRIVITSITTGDNTFIPKSKRVIKTGDMISFFCQKKDLKKIRKHFRVKSHDTTNTFIIGGGQVGYQVAKALEQTNHKVKFFDQDQVVCNKIANELKVDVFCTDNTDIETFESEGIASADVVISMMDDDYTNILTALLAKKLGAYKGVSLVNSKKLTKLAYSLGVDSTISPRLATASSILKYIRRGNILSVVEKDNAELIELKITGPCEITRGKIKDIDRPKGVIFGARKRDSHLCLISGDTKLEPGDLLVAYALSESIPKLEKLLESK